MMTAVFDQMLRKFPRREPNEEEKQKNLQQHTTDRQNTEKHTTKAKMDFIGLFVYVDIASEKV